MYVSKIYIPLTELSELFMKNLSNEDKEKFFDCDFIPIKVSINENDMSLETLFVPTPKHRQSKSVNKIKDRHIPRSKITYDAKLYECFKEKTE